MIHNKSYKISIRFSIDKANKHQKLINGVEHVFYFQLTQYKLLHMSSIPCDPNRSEFR